MRGCSRPRGRVPRLAAALAMVLALAVMFGEASAATSPATRDAASTRAFIQSSIRYDLGSLQRRQAIASAARGFVRGVFRGCGNGLVSFPSKSSAAQRVAVLGVELESSLALEVRAFAPIRALTDRIGRVQERLRFSDSALQWLVRSDAAATSALLAMHVPDVCADVRALASSHYESITPAGRRFLDDGALIIRAASAHPSSLARRMRAYAPAAVAAGIKRLSALQGRLQRTESLQPHDEALLRALFGGPPPRGL
jgi:hypothetical protein